MGKRGYKAGRKKFRIVLREGKYGSEKTRELPFGGIVTLRWSEFLTVHEKRFGKPAFCDYCRQQIPWFEPYVRGTKMRDEDYGVPQSYKRCMTCIGKGIMPHPDIVSVTITKR